VIFVGKSAAGKDHARKICEQWLEIPYQVSYTTRPPRENEQNGLDYNFISLDSAIHEYIEKDRFYQHVVFNGWVYGTTREQMAVENACFIMTPAAVAQLTEIDRNESLIIYLDIEEEIRRNRIYERNQCDDSVDRRMEADFVDFEGFSDYDERITNPRFYISDVWEIVAEHMDFPAKHKFIVGNNRSLIKAYNLLD